MKKSIFLTVLLAAFFVSAAIADPGDTLWTRAYGGDGGDYCYSVDQTTDGGYIVTGQTTLFGVGEVWLLKLDVSGDTVWTRTYAGSHTGNYHGRSVQQTTDGGYIVAGLTNSFGHGGYDFYLVKTDANGDSLWTRAYGGGDWDEGCSVEQTTDGGYIVAGRTRSFGAGGFDVYLVKTDANGGVLWTRTYGGAANEGTGYERSVQQTSDGGYIIAGYTYSFGAGGVDIYLINTDASGNPLWTRTYGGSADDYGNCVRTTEDGGYIVTGETESFGTGDTDIWVLKIDADGDTLWTRTYGGDGEEYGGFAQQTTDGGYIIGGDTGLWGVVNKRDGVLGRLLPPATGGFKAEPTGFDFYLIKTDANGDTLWTRTYGGSEHEFCYGGQQTADGGYISLGCTNSFGAGGYDFYLVRVAGEELPAVSIEITPDNPPVSVPQGGSFGFTGSLTNNIEDPHVTDAWTMAVGPQKETYGPFKMLRDVELEPFETRTADFNQHVPNLAPLGFYSYIAYCGDYPSTVMDSSSFQIEVVAGPLTKAGEAGWVLTGSFLEGDLADLPSEFALLSNYPNPFNASTQISYEVPATAHVKLEVYNLFGQKVATLVDGQQEAGYRSVTWEDSEAASGVYFYKLTAGDFTEVKRMTLLR